MQSDNNVDTYLAGGPKRKEWDSARVGNRVYSDTGKNGKSRVQMKHVSNETCERIKIEKRESQRQRRILRSCEEVINVG